jgi:hypothetical protein
MVILEQRLQLIFGGHPAITPMVRLQIAQTGASVGDFIVLYQSRYFQATFPLDNAAFERVELIDAVPGDRAGSLELMRNAMLAAPVMAGLFIGGMEGVEAEYTHLRRLQPNVPAFPIASTGAAAARIFENDPELRRNYPELLDEISYLSLMRNLIDIALRNQP